MGQLWAIFEACFFSFSGSKNLSVNTWTDSKCYIWLHYSNGVIHAFMNLPTQQKEKKPYSVNSATNGLENTFSIISIVEFNAWFTAYFWSQYRTKATIETFFQDDHSRYKLWYKKWKQNLSFTYMWFMNIRPYGGILRWVSSTPFGFPFSPLVLL